jgi:hypothetical protein
LYDFGWFGFNKSFYILELQLTKGLFVCLFTRGQYMEEIKKLTAPFYFIFFRLMVVKLSRCLVNVVVVVMCVLCRVDIQAKFEGEGECGKACRNGEFDCCIFYLFF